MRLGDRLGRHMVFADGLVQRLDVGVVELLGDVAEQATADLGHGQTPTPHRPNQIVVTGGDGIVATFAAEPLPDLVAGLRGGDELGASRVMARPPGHSS